MLFDPKWGPTVSPVTKPDIWALPTLIAWLEQQPSQKQYCYFSRGECLLAQYFLAMGLRVTRVGGVTIDYDDMKRVPLSADFQNIPVPEPRTFGAALDRARALDRNVA